MGDRRVPTARWLGGVMSLFDVGTADLDDELLGLVPAVFERSVGTGRFEIALSVPLLFDYEAVATRHLDMTGLVPSDLDDVLDYLCSVARRRAVFFLWRPFLRDPKDDMVLELAVAAEAQAIVTFNPRDFAGVEPFQLRVLTPQALLRELGDYP